MVKVLHFADAHIDMANYGRHDPESGIPYRIQDFLKSLDTIVDTAISEKVDLVLFAGDAYKDRTPAPTYQREWQKRIMKLSVAGIPTLLLIGNHDVSPAAGRANSFQEFDTLQVPHIRLISKPEFLTPQDLEGVPVQVLAMPWITRSTVAAAMLNAGLPEEADPLEHIQDTYAALVNRRLSEADPAIPVILLAHASVEGATYGGERLVMLGNDLVLSPGLVKDKRISYTALGHIHKKQNLNEGGQPPVVYPGSIERVDFGEAGDDKFFVIASVENGRTEVEFRQLAGIRPFIDRHITLENAEDVTGQLIQVLPDPERMKDAIVRLTIDYPRTLEGLVDENALRDYAANAFEFHLIRRPLLEARIRISADQSIANLPVNELTRIFWNASHMDSREQEHLQQLVDEIMQETEYSPEATPPA